MRRLSAAVRAALRMAAVTTLAVAFGDLSARGTTVDLAPPEEPVYAPNPEHVALHIDGWIIEVDGVSRGDAPAVKESAPAWRPAVPVVARVRRPPAVLSRYDDLIQMHASLQGLDWRLVAALIQEESGFKSEAVSSKGAIGLMQVRPIAAEDVGEAFFASPNDNIRTGVRYLKRLEGLFGAATPGRNRLGLVLAAYNAGPAHVQDAQVLARTYGFDPYRWDNSMTSMLRLLEDPTFYQRLPAGYAQGGAAVAYVERILNRYERYKVEAGEAPGLARPRVQAASASG